MRKIVSTDKAPGQLGPYSQGIIAQGSFVFTAGQIPMDPQTSEIVGSNITEQTREALKNLTAVLEEAGSELKNAIKTTVFLKDMNDFAAMNEEYIKFFPEAPPARSAVEVSRLPKDVLVEIECVALVK
ncbi:MAG: RidA family protein [Candidatus Electryonea clarkiae]|nr:RidA family protein [Candidatus Electryonea clarkiae]